MRTLSSSRKMTRPWTKSSLNCAPLPGTGSAIQTNTTAINTWIPITVLTIRRNRQPTSQAPTLAQTMPFATWMLLPQTGLAFRRTATAICIHLPWTGFAIRRRRRQVTGQFRQPTRAVQMPKSKSPLARSLCCRLPCARKWISTCALG